jgi:hypothetical protein
MLSYTVVVPLNVVDQCMARLVFCLESSIIHQLSFQCLIRRFHECIVVRIAFTTVWQNCSLASHKCRKVSTSKLGALVCVNDKPRCWPFLAEGLRCCLLAIVYSNGLEWNLVAARSHRLDSNVSCCNSYRLFVHLSHRDPYYAWAFLFAFYWPWSLHPVRSLQSVSRHIVRDAVRIPRVSFVRGLLSRAVDQMVSVHNMHRTHFVRFPMSCRPSWLSIDAAVPPNTEMSRSFGAPQDLEFF